MKEQSRAGWKASLACILGVLGLVETLVPARAGETTAWAALRQGAQVALMRHADAPGGAGDPQGFRRYDCTTQRNLSSKGRVDAQGVGRALKTEGVAIAKLLSLPWFRCVDSARLLELGAVEIEPTFANAFVLAEQRSTLTAGAETIRASCATVDPVFRRNDALLPDEASDRSQKCQSTFGSDALKRVRA